MSAISHTYREATPCNSGSVADIGYSVLDRNRKPLGYVDVAKLKESHADPVCRRPTISDLVMLMTFRVIQLGSI